VVNSSLFPQGDENSILIVAKLNKGKWEENEARAKGKS
jgi:hypothetical protein